MAVQVTTGSSSTGKANVNANFELEVHTPTTEANAGFVQISSENDAGDATGTRNVLSPETDNDFRLRVAPDALFDSETFNYTGINSAKYRMQSSGFVPAYGSGYVSFNPTSQTAANNAACLTTWKYFPIYGADETYMECVAAITTTIATGNTIEIGFYTTGTSAPYTPTDGAFIRVTTAGVVGVANYNGSETTTGVFAAVGGGNFAMAANTFYHFVVQVNEREVSFWVDDVLRGTIDLDTTGTGQPFIQGSLPLSITQRLPGTGGSAMTLRVSDYTVSKGGYMPFRSWETAMAAMGACGYQAQPGSTMGSTANYANSSNPTAAVPTNTTAALGTGLGGQFWETDTLAATTDGIICSYQNPAPNANITGRTLLVRGVKISSHVQTVLGAGAGYVASYSLAFGHTNVSLATTESSIAKAPRRVALGFQTVATTAAALTLLQDINVRFECPIPVQPGDFIAIVKKKIGAAPASGVIAHLITFDAVFE